MVTFKMLYRNILINTSLKTHPLYISFYSCKAGHLDGVQYQLNCYLAVWPVLYFLISQEGKFLL